MAYSNQQKALAVQTMRRFGGMTVEALDMIEQLFGGKRPSKSTLSGWLKEADEPNRTEIVPETEPIKKEMARKVVPERVYKEADYLVEDLLEQVAQKYLMRALDPEVIAALKGKEAVTAAAIAIDKLRLLQGLPTEIIGILPDLVSLCQAKGVNLAVVLREIMVQVGSGE